MALAMRRRCLFPLVIILVMICLTCCSAPGNGGSSQNPYSQQLTIGIHIAPWTLVDYVYSGNVEDPDWRVNVASNLEWLSEKGYNFILLDVMEAEKGTYFFQSDVLKQKGYNEDTDYMGVIVQEAHRLGMTVFADDTILAWRLDDEQTEKNEIGGEKLSIGEVQQVTATLLDDYDFDGIVEECFPYEYIEGISKTVDARAGKEYIHKFDDPWNNADILMSEDYVGFLSSPERVKEVEETGAAGNSLGLMNGLFAHAGAVGKPGWVKVTTDGYELPPGASHNVMLLRALQFNPSGYFWMPCHENGRELMRSDDPIMDVGLLKEYLSRFRESAGDKPVANIVFSLPFREKQEYRDDAHNLLVHALGPVSNALMLSGYDVRATYDDQVLPDADTYVVFTMGVAGEEARDLDPAILELLEGDKPVMLVSWETNNIGNWKKALPRLGISSDWNPSVTVGDIADVTYGDREIPWSSPPIWGYQVNTSVIEPDDVTSGEVVVSGKKDGEDIALITRSSNKFLVNANVLHLQTTFIFEDLFNGNLGEPFYGYGTVGRRSGFLAMEDTDLVVELPFEDGEEINILKFGSEGRLVEENETTYTGPLRMRLGQYELLVVEPATVSSR